MCHGELARRRPPPRYLTGYYMWISFGGMIGGMLTALVAPHIFSRIAEYPILLVLTLLCRPGLALAVARERKQSVFRSVPDHRRARALDAADHGAVVGRHGLADGRDHILIRRPWSEPR